MGKVIEYIGYEREGVEGLKGGGLGSRDMGQSRGRAGQGIYKTSTRKPATL